MAIINNVNKARSIETPIQVDISCIFHDRELKRESSRQVASNHRVGLENISN